MNKDEALVKRGHETNVVCNSENVESVMPNGQVANDEAIKGNRRSGRRIITNSALKDYVWGIK